MKKQQILLFLLSGFVFPLTSCGSAKTSSSVILSSSSSASSATSASSSESSLDLPLSKADKSSLAYLSSLDSLSGYKKTDWNAYWIWLSTSESNSYVAFRKNFSLSAKPQTAVAQIAAVDKYYLWVNGTLVVSDGGSKRGPTPFDTFYEDVDLAPYLIAGDNVIAVLVNYFGKSGNSLIDCGQGGFLFELDLGQEHLISDASWKACRLKEYKNDRLLRGAGPSLNTSIFLSEWNSYYSAKDRVGDYMASSYNDSAWNNASIVGKVGYEPYNDTYKNETPLIHFEAIKEAVDSDNVIGKKLTSASTLHFALPYNMQFSPYFELESDTADQLLTFYTDTRVIAGSNSFTDYYLAKEGAQSYELYPWRSGSVLTIEAPAGITFKKVGYRESYYASESKGRFASSDSSLDTLWEKAQRTLKICMRDNYMDCPERERSPYAGDGTNEIAETFYALDGNSYAMSKKTILTMLGWIKQDHVIQTRAPGTAGTKEIPMQNLAFMSAVYQYSLYSGEEESVRLFLPAAVNYLKLWGMESTGLVKSRPESADSTIWDWYDWGNFSDAYLLQNCWYYLAIDSLEKTSVLLGESSFDGTLSERKTSIKSAFVSSFKKEKGYASVEGSYDDRANALAVVSGLAAKEDYPLVSSILHTVEQASPYMEKYVLEALALMGEEEYAKTRMLKRYGDMIMDTSTTLWELWVKADGTPNHGWTGGPLTIMSRYFAGIAPVGLGYSSYTIAPVSFLDKIETTTVTPKGEIVFSLQKSGGTTTINLHTISAVGKLELPLALGSSLTVSGSSYTNEGVQAGRTILNLSGGDYVITLA